MMMKTIWKIKRFKTIKDLLKYLRMKIKTKMKMKIFQVTLNSIERLHRESNKILLMQDKVFGPQEIFLSIKIQIKSMKDISLQTILTSILRILRHLSRTLPQHFVLRTFKDPSKTMNLARNCM
jgi:hypothetical protein